MFRKLLATVGFAVSASAAAAPPYAPYREEATDAIYNLLFADDPAAFRASLKSVPQGWQSVLDADPADVPALERLAADESQEGRIRYLAYSRLRVLGRPVPPKMLLGVIVEVGLPEGLDTLATYADGGVRYVNRSGAMVLADDAPDLLPLVRRLLAAAAPVVGPLGPWDGTRRPPPARGSVRLSFLVSDGLYFGEGPMAVMQRDAMAAQVLQEATELLQAIVAATDRRK